MELITTILLIYFGGATLYVFIFALAGRFGYKSPKFHSDQRAKIAIFVPAYKEDFIMLSVASKLLECDYPKELYDVIVIADSFEQSTIAKLKELPIQLLEVEWEESTKAKSLNHALDIYDGKYDIAVISDADNILEKSFLQKINDAYQSGYLVIQGCRVAKNLNTSFAILDAASEAINNHIFRRGTNALGLSAPLIGSGMAFDYSLLKHEHESIKAVGGFDKELQYNIVKGKNRIIYLEDAVVYDEKIDKASTFNTQRRRWLSTQFVYLKKHFVSSLFELGKGNMNCFNFAFLFNIFLSRVLTLGSLFVFSAIYTVFALQFSIYWWGLLFVYGVSLLISLPPRMYTKKTLFALLSLPQAFIIMVISLFKLKGANKKFIHTAHTNIEVDNSILITSDKQKL